MFLQVPPIQASCRNCFFGVEQLCCLNSQEGKACPTYRAADGKQAVCLRRRPKSGRMGERGMAPEPA